MTRYQKCINEAAAQLASAEPSLVMSRQKLLDRARDLVREGGYEFKKGKSRSKKLVQDTECAEPKRPKTSEGLRIKRIKQLEDDVSDFNDRLQFKEKRRQQATNARNYKLCDQLTEEMSEIKHKKRACEQELESWKRKQHKSSWYKKHKGSSSSSSSGLSVLSGDDKSVKSSSRSKLPRRKILFDFDQCEEDESSSLTESSTLADVSDLSSQNDVQPIVDLTTDVTTSQNLQSSPISVSTSSAYSPMEHEACSPASDDSESSSSDQVFQ